MQEMLTTVLMVGSAVFAAGAFGFLAVGLYTNVFERFIVEVKEESAGGVSGVGSVMVRKMGVANRRFMWPGYEAKMRRRLIKSGDPKGYKPEDMMALQEIGFVVGLLFGLIVANAAGWNLAVSLGGAIIGLFYPMIWINDQVKKRHLQISRALPFNLDLLTPLKQDLAAGKGLPAEDGGFVYSLGFFPGQKEPLAVMNPMWLGRARFLEAVKYCFNPKGLKRKDEGQSNKTDEENH